MSHELHKITNSMKQTILLFSLILFQSCQSQEATKISLYFDVKGYISNQINLLNAAKPKVSKTVTVGDKVETKVISGIDWAKELEFFVESDLNKPAFVGSYDIVENDSLKSYHLKSSGKNLVKYLIIKKKDNGQEEISAQISESNYLYESEKNLQAVFENKKLKSYQIEGFQKVILGEKKPYKIAGQIL
jgi:uncharacterized secreted protein with C-terminal beta-propeller domain